MKLSVKEFLASIDTDSKLYNEEIDASIVHAKMLSEQGFITSDEADRITEALEEIRTEIDAGKLNFSTAFDDIHGNIEAFLMGKIGPLAKKLKIARGVNDQVVTDTRLFLKKEALEINALLKELLDTLENLASEHVNTIIPGYSHLQRAQPITLAYYLLAYHGMFKRDLKRFENCIEGLDFLPPDCGSTSGTVCDTDRTQIMEDLGFSGITANSMDAISDRDFAMEFVNDCAITMMHLSRFCEDMILWDTVEFNFIEIADEYCTTSKAMPKKRNLDVAELIRGKSGRVFGDVVSLLTVFKGLPMSYNRDMQEDKEPAIDAANTLESSLSLFVDMIKSVKINRGEMQRAAKYGYMNAAELADYLIGKGVAPDKCEEIIGKVVDYAINNNKPIEELWLDDLKQFSQVFDSDVYDKIAIRNVIESKVSKGSTSFTNVQQQLDDIKAEKEK